MSIIKDISDWLGPTLGDATHSTKAEQNEAASAQGGGTHGSAGVWSQKAGQDTADWFWNNYGQQAANNYQQMGGAAQAQMSALGQASQSAGGYYGGMQSNLGMGYGQQLSAAGQTLGQNMTQAGQGYAGSIGSLGNQAAAGGLGYANAAGAVGQAGAESLASQAALLNQQAAAAQGRAPVMTDYTRQTMALDRATRGATDLATLEAQQGPSAAQAQLQNALNQSQASNLAMARSGRGLGGGVSAMRQASDQNAMAGQQAVNASAMLRAQEDAAWRQRQAGNLGASAGINQGVAGQFGAQETQGAQLALQQQQQNDALMTALYGQGGQLMGQGANLGLQSAMGAGQLGQNAYGQQLDAYGRAADVGLGAQQAGMNAALQGIQGGGQMALTGLGQAAQTELTGLNQAGNQYMQGFGGNMAAQGAAGQVWGAGQQGYQQAIQNYLQGAAIDQGVSIANAQSQNNMLAAGLSAGGALLGTLVAPGPGTIAGAGLGAAAGQAAGQGAYDASKNPSDRRVKTDIVEATLDLLDKAPGFTYRYKDPAHGEGKFLGPMAQDLEKSEIGASMVSTGADGIKRVDTGRAGLAALGGLSVLKREFETKLDSIRSEIESLGKSKRRAA